jgi:alpha-beta hydrolase superfamily lysophospholipase
LTVEVKPKLLLETFALSFKAWVNAKKLSNIPLLMIVASGDPITDSKVAEQYFAFCNAKDKELKTFSINKHDLFILPEADETNCLIAEWILKNTSS